MTARTLVDLLSDNPEDSDSIPSGSYVSLSNGYSIDTLVATWNGIHMDVNIDEIEASCNCGKTATVAINGVPYCQEHSQRKIQQ